MSGIDDWLGLDMTFLFGTQRGAKWFCSYLFQGTCLLGLFNSVFFSLPWYVKCHTIEDSCFSQHIYKPIPKVIALKTFQIVQY